MARKLVESTGSSEITVFKYRSGGKKKKKRSKKLKGLERVVNRTAKAGETFFTNYRDRHNKSTRKKKNGWLKKLDKNLYKAGNKSRKKLKLKKLFRL